MELKEKEDQLVYFAHKSGEKKKTNKHTKVGGALVSWLVRIRRPVFEPLPGHCVVFFGKTHYFHIASPHKGV